MTPILRTHGEEADPETDNLLKESISTVMDEGMKKFSCNICNSLFTKKQSAKSHIITIHQGRKDYVCSQCNKALGKKHALKEYEQFTINTSSFWEKYRIKYYPVVVQFHEIFVTKIMNKLIYYCC